MEKEFVTMTEEEFHKKGVQLFGDDYFAWKFKCPLCGNVQSVEDFRQFKEQGANPNSAYQECVGRYREDPYRVFGENKKNHEKSPCDYAAFGFFNIGNIVKMNDGTEIVVFPFAE